MLYTKEQMKLAFEAGMDYGSEDSLKPGFETWINNFHKNLEKDKKQIFLDSLKEIKTLAEAHQKKLAYTTDIGYDGEETYILGLLIDNKVEDFYSHFYSDEEGWEAAYDHYVPPSFAVSTEYAYKYIPRFEMAVEEVLKLAGYEKYE